MRRYGLRDDQWERIPAQNRYKSNLVRSVGGETLRKLSLPGHNLMLLFRNADPTETELTLPKTAELVSSFRQKIAFPKEITEKSPSNNPIRNI